MDFIVLAGYFMGWILVWCAYCISPASQYYINYGMMFMGYLVPIIMYVWYYKRLRVLPILLLWLMIGTAQVLLMPFLKENPDFDSFNGSYATTLVYLPCMLVTYTLMRWLYKLFYKDELVITAGRYHWVNYEDGRKLRFLDYILSIVGALLFLLPPAFLLD